MKVTIDTTNKTFEVCAQGEPLDFNNLIVELQKTIERCKGTITIPNNTSTTGIPFPYERIPYKDAPKEIPKNEYWSNNQKTASQRSNFQ